MGWVHKNDDVDDNDGNGDDGDDESEAEEDVAHRASDMSRGRLQHLQFSLEYCSYFEFRFNFRSLKLWNGIVLTIEIRCAPWWSPCLCWTCECRRLRHRRTPMRYGSCADGAYLHQFVDRIFSTFRKFFSRNLATFGCLRVKIEVQKQGGNCLSSLKASIPPAQFAHLRSAHWRSQIRHFRLSRGQYTTKVLQLKTDFS